MPVAVPLALLCHAPHLATPTPLHTPSLRPPRLVTLASLLFPPLLFPTFLLPACRYLSNQIHPPVSRLVDVIEGTDSARIAECLGLDPAKFSGGGSGGGPADSAADDVFGAALEDDEARFSDAAPLQLGCAACGEVSRARPLHAALAAPADGKHPCLACPHCGTDYDGVAMHNGLTLAMRAAERAYYTVRGGARALADLAPSAPARLRTQPLQTMRRIYSKVLPSFPSFPSNPACPRPHRHPCIRLVAPLRSPSSCARRRRAAR